MVKGRDEIRQARLENHQQRVDTVVKAVIGLMENPLYGERLNEPYAHVFPLLTTAVCVYGPETKLLKDVADAFREAGHEPSEITYSENLRADSLEIPIP